MSPCIDIFSIFLPHYLDTDGTSDIHRSLDQSNSRSDQSEPMSSDQSEPEDSLQDEEKTVKCKYCGERTVPSNFKRHIKACKISFQFIKKIGKLYECSLCSDKKFERRSSIYAHIRLRHANGRKVSKENGLKLKIDLKKEKIKSASEKINNDQISSYKEFKCKICEIAFLQQPLYLGESNFLFKITPLDCNYLKVS